jgi:hypothetical protein
MIRQWFFQVMGSEIGPVSSLELKQRVQRGQIQADTLVRAAPDGKWQSADRIKGLIDPPATPAATPATKPADSATIPLSRNTLPEDRTYHFAGDTAVDITPPEEPKSGEYDFFQFVGFEQALGLKLHQALVAHCHSKHVTLTMATRQAVAGFLNRKDLLEDEAAAEAEAKPSVS